MFVRAMIYNRTHLYLDKNVNFIIESVVFLFVCFESKATTNFNTINIEFGAIQVKQTSDVRHNDNAWNCAP